MRLHKNEQIIKVFHHHATARFIRAAKIVIAGLPFYFVAWFFRGLFSPGQMIVAYLSILFVNILVLLYDSILYYLDRMVVTNKRILYIDWTSPFSNTEHEADVFDIQDIETTEKGIIAFLPIFDYGDFTLETASNHTTIYFPCAPDPEDIKDFIYHLGVKPRRVQKRDFPPNHHDKKERQHAKEFPSSSSVHNEREPVSHAAENTQGSTYTTNSSEVYQTAQDTPYVTGE